MKIPSDAELAPLPPLDPDRTLRILGILMLSLGAVVLLAGFGALLGADFGLDRYNEGTGRLIRSFNRADQKNYEALMRLRTVARGLCFVSLPVIGSGVLLLRRTRFAGSQVLNLRILKRA